MYSVHTFIIVQLHSSTVYIHLLQYSTIPVPYHSSTVFMLSMSEVFRAYHLRCCCGRFNEIISGSALRLFVFIASAKQVSYVKNTG